MSSSVWLCFTITGLAVLAKVLGRIWRRDPIPLGSDEVVMSIALIAAFAQSLVVSRQVAAGLGTNPRQIPASQQGSYEKLGYTSQFLYVVTIGSAKVATFLFAVKLGALRHLPKITYAGIFITSVWFITSGLLVAFQCQGPYYWKIYSGRCISQSRFWSYVEVFNTSIDISFVIVLNFLTASHEEARIAIATALAMDVSVLVTCIPFLKPFMEQLQPGWSTSDIRRGVGYGASQGKQSRSIVVSFSDRFPMGSVVASSAN
ncbi:hypothetical protein BU24DRAFT_415483 [Aaosphaeria arxii CBS 175.79]|uniref:Rhodopsin domain-containing protein n=1 Tax=Aaosphaeria arxii CBS 175.79 TaxID=1450172 RepID=A0A6A5X7H0_9PLEO|nr:uncharacterized protein BU24DRAFT_415483 [Aaosphaeria arxii CBS 175.79]KAF2008734.1 hypothetical protein BU24DRAFT_415483 [Aaosphaeria arxii CBS 175.79]